MTAAVNACDTAIETVLRDSFWYNPSIGHLFDFDHVNTAACRRDPAPAGLGRRRNRGRRWTTLRWQGIETTTRKPPGR
jgi:hypothetical protein